MPKTNTNQKPGSGSATCSVIDSPEAELRHLKEMAEANGFNSITEAIVAAKHYREIEADRTSSDCSP